MMRFEKILMLLLIVIGVTFLQACSNEKEEPTNPIPEAKSILVGSSFSLGQSGKWRTSNNFVASVDNAGNVSAEHVGECTISNGRQNCKVTVKPKSNLIKEPITEWGISKSQLISKSGSDYIKSGNSIGYKTNNSIAPITMYSFDNNDRLSSSLIIVDTNYTSDLADFLIERYQPVAVDGYDFYFTDGYTTQSITTAIGMSLYEYDKNYWLVLYMPYGKSSRSTEDNDLSENLYEIIGN